MSLRWYDYVWFPWTVTKWTWEKLRPQRPEEPGRPPQAACYGRPLSLAYGKTRLTGNALYAASTVSVGPPPTLPIVLALCEGPITGVDRVWRDKEVTSAPGNWLITIYTGTRPTQTAWTVPPADKQLGYPGIAYAAAAWPMTAARISRMSFEVKGLLYNTGGSNGDAHPADILKGTPTNETTQATSMLCRWDYGAGFPFEVVTDTGRDGNEASSYRRYVAQAGLWISPAFTDQRPAREHLDDVLAATNATCLWTGGKLEIVPLGDQAVGTYTPVTTVQYAIEPGYYATEDDRTEIELPPETDSFNIVPVEFLDRAPTSASTDTAHAYNVAIAEDPEPVDVALRGERRASTVAMHAICDRDTAVKIARILSQRMVRGRARYTFRLAWRYCRLEPLDIVTLTDSLLGLDAQPVRIDRITEEPDTRTLTIEATEWTAGVSNAVAHTVQSSDGPTAGLETYDAELRLHETAALNWTSVTTSPYQGIAFSGSRFVAVAPNKCATSEDGTTWTAQTIPAGNYYPVAWNGSVFCTVGAASECATSPDGVTWTSRTIPAGGYYGLTWNGSVFVALGSSGVCATSPDGTTWTSRTLPAAVTYFDVTWNGSVFVAVGNSVCATSPDGTTWTSRTIPAGSYYAAEWNGSVFVAVGNNVCASSPDGTTWTAQTLPGDASGRSFSSIAWSGRIFCALASRVTGLPPVSITSQDGETWTTNIVSVANGGSGGGSEMIWAARMFVAVGSPGITHSGAV